MLNKICLAKAKSLLAGNKLHGDINMCHLMCCHVCPFMCGCSKLMNIQGSVKIQTALEGDKAFGILAAGAPKGPQDLEMVEQALTKHGFAKSSEGKWVEGATTGSEETPGAGAPAEASNMER